jgi:hypothetical protein
MRLKIAVIASALMWGAAAHSQGYVGAVVALSNVDFECQPRFSSCDKSGPAGKVYFGQKVSGPSWLGQFSPRSVEVVYLRFGSANAKGTGTIDVSFDDGFEVVRQTRPAPIAEQAETDAIAVAGVWSMEPLRGTSLSAKAGIAYVSSTIKASLDGRSNGAKTQSRWQPYLGFGAAYGLADTARVVANLDVTRFDVDGRKGLASMLGLGAELDF